MKIKIALLLSINFSTGIFWPDIIDIVTKRSPPRFYIFKTLHKIPEHLRVCERKTSRARTGRPGKSEFERGAAQSLSLQLRIITFACFWGQRLEAWKRDLQRRNR